MFLLRIIKSKPRQFGRNKHNFKLLFSLNSTFLQQLLATVSPITRSTQEKQFAGAALPELRRIKALCKKTCLGNDKGRMWIPSSWKGSWGEPWWRKSQHKRWTQQRHPGVWRYRSKPEPESNNLASGHRWQKSATRLWPPNLALCFLAAYQGPLLSVFSDRSKHVTNTHAGEEQQRKLACHDNAQPPLNGCGEITWNCTPRVNAHYIYATYWLLFFWPHFNPCWLHFKETAALD